jgi:3-oxoacyl-[acyl-carrier protein] reductase
MRKTTVRSSFSRDRGESKVNFGRQVAIVTGGASGIGRAVVTRLIESGIAGIVVADCTFPSPDRRSRVRTTKVLHIQTDIANPDSVAHMVSTAMASFGRIDILVNNASICPVTAWDDTTVENWNQVLGINLTGMFICTKAVVPIMKRQKFGRIVYVSSTAADVGSLVAHVAYGVSKAGVIALMKSVAKGFARYGITANAVSPGTIDTPLTKKFDRKIQKGFIDNCVLKRQGKPAEVADAILYLVSGRSTYITGQVLHVDGGFFLR